MKAKYKIGMLLFYTNGNQEDSYGKIKAVVHHESHAEYLMTNDDHVSEADVQEAFTPVATKKAAKKRAPKKSKGEAAPVDQAE